MQSQENSIQVATESQAGQIRVGGHSDVWAAYSASIDGAERTKQTYTRALKVWRSWLDEAGLSWDSARREHVLAFRAGLQAAGYKPATVNAYLAAVRSFYRFTEAERIYPNVAAGVKGLKRSTAGAKDALTVEQAARYAAPASGERTLKQLRDDALAVLMVTRGLRTIEVARADVGDVRQVGGRAVLMVQGKGYTDKGDMIVLSPEILDAIYRYLDARGHVEPSDPLFASTSNRNAGGRMSTRSISHICKERLHDIGATSDRLTAHSLRHTAVTLALLGGATVQEVQQLARHSSINTTMLYAHNLERLEGAGERAVDSIIHKASAA